MIGTLTPSILYPLLAELRRTRPDEQLIGVRLEGAWSGEQAIQLGDALRPIRVCPSVIDVHEAAVEQEALGQPLVILTPLRDRDLGLDLTSRLAGQQLLRPSLHRSVMQLFEAHDIDRRIATEDWLLRALVEHLPPSGYVPVPFGSLTADRAWEELLRSALDLPVGAPTLTELLRWAQSDVHRVLLQTATPELRAGVRSRLAPVAGADLLLAIVAHADSVAETMAVIGVLSVLTSLPDEPAVLLATGRLAERHLGGSALDLAEDAPALVASARRLVETEGVGASWDGRARELIGDLGLDARLPASDLLDEAWNVRLSEVGHSLIDALAGAVGATDRVGDARTALARHVRARAASSAETLASVEAMLRLTRWLATPPPGIAVALSGAIADEVAEGGWVVVARAHLSAPGAPELVAAAARIAQAVDARRSRGAAAFAALAVRWDGDASSGLIGVEHVLEQVVAPTAAAVSTVVVVLDGMSVAVLRQLLSDLDAEGWAERRPTAFAHRPAALAVLPSLTTYSRSSLLTGHLTGGGQAAEKTGFANHVGLRQAGTTGGAPLLLHKRELSDDGTTLNALVRDELFGARRVVGLVINAIDDDLGGAVQRRGGWSLAEIPLLGAVMAAARDAERAVVLLSDHGHVPERSGTHRVPAGPGAGHRHRSTASGPAAEGEVLASGARVLPAGAEVVLAADPAIRYSAGTEPGYHGGASPEELVTPVAIVTAFDRPLDGLVEQPPDEPTWWRHEESASPPTPPPAPVVQRRRSSRAPGPGQATLDGLMEPPVPVVAPGWVDALLSHPGFKQSRERGGRGTLADERARALLVALAAHDGRLSVASLAAAAAVPRSRLEGALALLSPLLNVDGYPILTVDPSADLVELRIADLRRQFEV